MSRASQAWQWAAPSLLAFLVLLAANAVVVFGYLVYVLYAWNSVVQDVAREAPRILR
jgi:hypothetical protein